MKIALIIVLLAIIIISGCIELDACSIFGLCNTPTQVNKIEQKIGPKDVVKIASVNTLPLSPVHPDNSMLMMFELENKDNDPMKIAQNVIVDVYDAPTLKSSDGSMLCNSRPSLVCMPEQCSIETPCKILPTASKYVNVPMKTPTRDELGDIITEPDIRYQISYDFESTTRYDMLVVNPNEILKKQKAGEKLPMTQTIIHSSGPIKIDLNLQGQDYIMSNLDSSILLKLKDEGVGDLRYAQIDTGNLDIYIPEKLVNPTYDNIAGPEIVMISDRPILTPKECFELAAGDPEQMKYQCVDTESMDQVVPETFKGYCDSSKRFECGLSTIEKEISLTPELRGGGNAECVQEAERLYNSNEEKNKLPKVYEGNEDKTEYSRQWYRCLATNVDPNPCIEGTGIAVCNQANGIKCCIPKEGHGNVGTTTTSTTSTTITTPPSPAGSVVAGQDINIPHEYEQNSARNVQIPEGNMITGMTGDIKVECTPTNGAHTLFYPKTDGHIAIMCENVDTTKDFKLYIFHQKAVIQIDYYKNWLDPVQKSGNTVIFEWDGKDRYWKYFFYHDIEHAELLYTYVLFQKESIPQQLWDFNLNDLILNPGRTAWYQADAAIRVSKDMKIGSFEAVINCKQMGNDNKIGTTSHKITVECSVQLPTLPVRVKRNSETLGQTGITFLIIPKVVGARLVLSKDDGTQNLIAGVDGGSIVGIRDIEVFSYDVNKQPTQSIQPFVFEWDGLDNYGRPLPMGTYDYTVEVVVRSPSSLYLIPYTAITTQNSVNTGTIIIEDMKNVAQGTTCEQLGHISCTNTYTLDCHWNAEAINPDGTKGKCESGSICSGEAWSLAWQRVYNAYVFVHDI